jgi:tetratricopeptide (TPR) repeat protein
LNIRRYILHRLGRQAEALMACDRVIDLQPANASAWSEKGFLLNLLGRHAEALKAFERATELDPENAFAWSDKGFTLEILGRHAEALKACEQATKLDPKDAFAWSRMGCTLNILGRHAEALKACEQATELDPENAYSWENRGRAKIGLGQFEGAIQDLRQAIALKPGLAGAFDSLAEAHILQGNWVAAEEILFKRFRLPASPDNVARSWYMPDLITSIFRSSLEQALWTYRVGRLVDIAQEVREEVEQKKAQDKAKPAPSSLDTTETPAPPNLFAMLGDSLVRSLKKRPYAAAPMELLDAWASVWREVAERHLDLSLAARLFGIGVRYLRTKDERVLLDLVREERFILRDLFGLDDGADAS